MNLSQKQAAPGGFVQRHRGRALTRCLCGRSPAGLSGQWALPLCGDESGGEQGRRGSGGASEPGGRGRRGLLWSQELSALQPTGRPAARPSPQPRGHFSGPTRDSATPCDPLKILCFGFMEANQMLQKQIKAIRPSPTWELWFQRWSRRG